MTLLMGMMRFSLVLAVSARRMTMPFSQWKSLQSGGDFSLSGRGQTFSVLHPPQPHMTSQPRYWGFTSLMRGHPGQCPGWGAVCTGLWRWVAAPGGDRVVQVFPEPCPLPESDQGAPDVVSCLWGHVSVVGVKPGFKGVQVDFMQCLARQAVDEFPEVAFEPFEVDGTYSRRFFCLCVARDAFRECD